MRSTLTWVSASAIAVFAVFLACVVVDQGNAHKYAVVLPNAIGLVSGTPVQLAGRTVGKVDSISPKNDKAVVAIVLNDLSAPLPSGTTVTVEWRSLLGERYLQLRAGPATNPSLPDGAILQTGSSQVVVEELLETLDAPTRRNLASMLQQLDHTMAGHQNDFNQTLKEAGPYVNDVGAVLDAVGSDGRAIKGVLTNLQKVTAVLANRRGRLSSTVLDLRELTGTAAVHQRQLSDSVAQLPETLNSVKEALDRVPHAVDATAPVLDDLRPGTAQLPRLARNLSPVLRDLRRSARLLWPTLDATDRLLGRTPRFLDVAHRVLPALQTTVERAGPAVSFLRPYTPEIMGFLSGWGGVYSTYDAQGHLGHSLVPGGQSAINNSPNIATPGELTSPRMAPGENVNQPWLDAAGSGER